MGINVERLWSDITTFAEIGRCGGKGVDRAGYSTLELEAMALLSEKLAALGLASRKDAAGNLMALLPGTDASLPAIAIGSHLDTVPDGGWFDGALGVLSSLEVLRSLLEQKIDLRHSVELICFAGEEASRFGVSLIGSRAMMGELSLSEVMSRRDSSGVTIADAMLSVGVDPKAATSYRRNPGELAAFVELHIEQGRVLETEGKEVGLVTAIANSTRLQVVLRGRSDHSGSTPMHLREDALVAGADVIREIRRIGEVVGRGVGVATVTIVESKPSSMSVIPGYCRLGIDIRDIDSDRKASMVEALQTFLTGLGAESGIAVESEVVKDAMPIVLDDRVAAIIEESLTERNVPYRRMNSGAGHDAMTLAPYVPTAMLFVPSKDGISHSSDEWTDKHQVGTGADALLSSVIALDRKID